jgi:hypothetical protein
MSKVETCPECGCIIADPAEHSDAARRRFFAIIRDAFDNMPEHWKALLPSSEHLRKFVLCRIGHCDVVTTDCSTKAAAERVALLARQLDSFAVVDVRGALVTTMVAKSLRKRVCPKAVFMPLTALAYDYLRKMTGYDVEHSEFAEQRRAA